MCACGELCCAQDFLSAGGAWLRRGSTKSNTENYKPSLELWHPFEFSLEWRPHYRKQCSLQPLHSSCITAFWNNWWHLDIALKRGRRSTWNTMKQWDLLISFRTKPWHEFLLCSVFLPWCRMLLKCCDVRGWRGWVSQQGVCWSKERVLELCSLGGWHCRRAIVKVLWKHRENLALNSQWSELQVLQAELGGVIESLYDNCAGGSFWGVVLC